MKVLCCVGGECSSHFLLAESWPSGEVQRWELGRKKLAAVMGADPDSFSEKEVTEALRYLLPTRLTAVDAQPLLKVNLPLYTILYLTVSTAASFKSF